MKNPVKFLPLVILSIVFIGCNGGKKTPQEEKKILKQEIMKMSVEYASGILNNPVKQTGVGGAIILADPARKLIVEPSKIYTGPINDDQSEDAIITLTSVRGSETDILVHLVFLAKEGSFEIIQSIESDMKILNIKNGIITVQMPTHKRSSPLFNCASCQEIQQYRLVNNKLEKLEINKSE